MHSAILLVSATLLSIASSYQHPQQVLHQLKQAHDLSEELKTNPNHELFDWHRAFQGLTPERVYQELVNLASTSRADNGTDYEISERCANQTIFMLQNMRIPTQMRPSWATNMIDAWGKPGSGIFQLNLKWLGDFDECQDVKSASENHNVTLPDHLNFQGQYCTVGPPPNAGINPMAAGGGLSLGVCFPSGCSEGDISSVISSILHDVTSLKPNSTYNSHIGVECQERDMEYSNSAIAAIVLYTLMGALCLAATLYNFVFIMMTPDPEQSGEKPHMNGHSHTNGDLRKSSDGDTQILISPSEKQEPPKHNAFGEFLMCFSLYTNGYKILSTKQPPGALTCLNGIRFISMLWVILGHTLVFSTSSIKNIITIFAWTKRWSFMVITNATVSVDSFFVLSGLLTCYLFLKELDKKHMGVVRFLTTVPVMWLHRYIRLTPAYGFMILFYACLGLYTFSGPLKPTHTPILDPNCINHTWSALLYVNNVIDPLKECAAWGWYLANDFQFYLVTPFVVYIMYRSPIVGLILSSVMVVVSAGAATGISVADDLGMGLFGGREPNVTNPMAQANEMQDYYMAPWARYQSYGVGVLFGYVLWYCYTKYDGRLPISRAVNLILWAISGAIMLAVLYGPHDAQAYVHVATKGEAGFYNGWSRTAWSLSLGYIMLACCLGRGGWVNEFLSWPGFVPVSRMTYCAYLVHPVIMTIFSSAHKSLSVWSEITIIYMFGAYVLLSFSMAFLFSIVFEAPFMLVDKKYLTGRLSKVRCSR